MAEDDLKIEGEWKTDGHVVVKEGSGQPTQEPNHVITIMMQLMQPNH